MVVVKNLNDFFQYNSLCPICQEPLNYTIYNLNKAYCRLLTNKFLIKFKENFNYPREIEFEIGLENNSIRILNDAKTKYPHYFPIEIERICAKNHLGFYISTHLNFNDNILSVMRNSVEEKFISLLDAEKNKTYTLIERPFMSSVSITIYDKVGSPDFLPKEEKMITLNHFDIFNLVKGDEARVLKDVKKMLSLI